MAAPATPYDPAHDLTLNSAQASTAQFKSAADFRNPSNPTVHGYSSGYHEAALTTDMYNRVGAARKGKGDTFGFNYGRSDGPLAQTHTLQTATVDQVLALGDGFRTDTAQTILSAPEGAGAGHSGSGMYTQGQAPAHDLLRAAMLDIMEDGLSDEAGINTKSISAAMGAINIASMAPAVLARTVQAKPGLKAAEAGPVWEQKRTLAKARLNNIMQTLGPKERDYVIGKAQKFLTSTMPAPAAGETPNRVLASGRGASPDRVIHSAPSDAIQGGQYLDALIDNTSANLSSISALPPGGTAVSATASAAVGGGSAAGGGGSSAGPMPAAAPAPAPASAPAAAKAAPPATGAGDGDAKGAEEEDDAPAPAGPLLDTALYDSEPGVPADPMHWGLYLSQPFRAQRRQAPAPVPAPAPTAGGGGAAAGKGGSSTGGAT